MAHFRFFIVARGKNRQQSRGKKKDERLMEIAEGWEHKPWLEARSLTEKGKKPQKRQSPSLNHSEIIGKKVI